MDSEKEVQCIPTKKDHFILIIDGINNGEKERSKLRHIIGEIDNKI
tara:strand:+ start:45 stop:182 length:138 start_codon:yes stop_codon:yes gene_type:complete